MTIDPDEAIEKLTEYRKDSEAKKKEKTDHKIKLSPFELKLRAFLIKFYRVNVVVYVIIGVLMIFGMEYTETPLFLDVMLGGIALIFPFQIFSTISRLERTRGRKTTIDDVFATSILIPMFLLLLFYTNELFSPVYFWILYAILSIIWILQIVYVNYRKPDIEYVSKSRTDTEVEKGDQVAKSRFMQLITFFSVDRVIMLALGVVVAVGFLYILPPV